MSLRVQGSSAGVKAGFTKTSSVTELEKGGNAKLAEPKTSKVPETAGVGEEVPMAEVQLAVENINGAMEFINRGLKFSVHEGTERVMVEVIDRVTNEVIKEIPPRELLDTLALIREMVGLLIDAWA